MTLGLIIVPGDKTIEDYEDEEEEEEDENTVEDEKMEEGQPFD